MTSGIVNIVVRGGVALLGIAFVIYPIAREIHAARVSSKPEDRSITVAVVFAVLGLVLLVAAIEVEDWSGLYRGGPGPSGGSGGYPY